MRGLNVTLLFLMFYTFDVRAGHAQPAEANIEARAARACAGWGNTTNKSQGTVTVDNLSIKGDGKGTITVYRDGVDLGRFSNGTFDQYQKCLIEVIKLISPNRPLSLNDDSAMSDYSAVNTILSDLGIDARMGGTYKSRRDNAIELVKPGGSTQYSLLKEGFPDIQQPVAAVQIRTSEEVEKEKDVFFDGYAFLDAKTGIVIAICLRDGADEGYDRGGPALIESWKQRFGYDTQNYIETSRSVIKNVNGWSRIVRSLKSFSIDLGSSLLWWDGRADDEIRVCGDGDPTCVNKQIEGKVWGQTLWIEKKQIASTR